MGDYIGTIIGVIKGDTRNLDSGSYRDCGGIILDIHSPLSALGSLGTKEWILKVVSM